MRNVAWLGWLLLGIASTGCVSLGGKGPNKAEPTARTVPPRQDLSPPLPPTPATPTSAVGGIIAGQVLDILNNRNARATIELIAPADGDGAPVVRTLSTDDRGYFTILNVRPGVSYQLVARSQDGTPVMSGAAWVQPPNARVIIRVSEDYNLPAPAAPPPPPPVTARPPVVIERPTPLPTQPPDNARRPAAEMGAPAPTPPRRPDLIVGDRSSADPKVAIPPAPRLSPPPAVTTPRLETPTPAPASAAPTGRDNTTSPRGVTLVPSCQLVGKQLVNFALAGVDGQPWEFRRDRRGKLVLLDFWGTWCPACRYGSKEHLPKLQTLYGRSGLEIVGIAYEKDRTWRDQVQKVQNARAQDGINYRVLMGYGPECPVKQQFGVQVFPTLFLLDENGKILWQSEGLDEAGFETLKVVIRQSLGLQ